MLEGVLNSSQLPQLDNTLLEITSYQLGTFISFGDDTSIKDCSDATQGFVM